MRAIRDRLNSLSSEFTEIDYSDEVFNNIIEDSISETELSVTYNSETGSISSSDVSINNKLFYYCRIKLYEKIADYFTEKAISISDGAGSGDFRERAKILMNKVDGYKKEYNDLYGKRSLLFTNMSSIS